MENTGDWEQKKALINEVKQGRDLARQLQTHLDTSSSPQVRELIVLKILSSFNKALSMLKCSGNEEPQQMLPTAATSDSPPSDNGSPRSEESDHRDVAKKRKTMPLWSQQVHACSGMGLEGIPDDGYSWRKYGQKDILGAKFPRGYFRCTHRNVQGCLATKQVQRSDDDPSILEITYRGIHTCVQASRLNLATTSAEKQEAKLNKEHQHEQQQNMQQSQEILFNFQTGLQVKTDMRELSSTFSFPSTSFGCIKNDNKVFLPSAPDNSTVSSFSPSFLSTTKSESSYFSPYPCQMNFGAENNLQTTESDLTGMISAATSATNSPVVDMKFPLDPVEFDFDVKVQEKAEDPCQGDRRRSMYEPNSELPGIELEKEKSFLVQHRRQN